MEDLRKKIYKRCLDLNKLFKFYSNGDLILADRIVNRFFKLTGNGSTASCDFPRFDVSQNSVFYRSCTWEAKNRNDIFHPPFEKRGKIGSNRFSYPGYPCLYLSSSIRCSYEEVVKEKGFFYVSAFKNLKSIDVYDFRFFPSGHNDKNLLRKIISYPFKIAAAIPLQEKNVNNKYIEEYIIPQIILHSVIRQKNGSKMMGILFTSTKAFKKGFQNDDYERYQNLVMPACYIKKEGYCKVLQDLFELTEPEKIEKFGLMKDDLLENKICSKVFCKI